MHIYQGSEVIRPCMDGENEYVSIFRYATDLYPNGWTRQSVANEKATEINEQPIQSWPTIHSIIGLSEMTLQVHVQAQNEAVVTFFGYIWPHFIPAKCVARIPRALTEFRALEAFSTAIITRVSQPTP